MNDLEAIYAQLRPWTKLPTWPIPHNLSAASAPPSGAIPGVLPALQLPWPVAGRVRLRLCAMNFVLGRAPAWATQPPVVFHKTLMRSGLAPLGLPKVDHGRDGSSACTVRMYAYLAMIQVPFAGVEELLMTLNAADLVPDAEAPIEDTLMFPAPFVIPQGVEAQMRDFSWFDHGDARRTFWQLINDAEGPMSLASDWNLEVEDGALDELAESAHRYVRNEVMLRHIVRLRSAMAPFGRPVTINLYSEGIVADFQAFADAGCNLHISEDAFETFHNMVTADILMIAHSSFSHLAGILSQGIVLDHRVRAVQFPGWLHRRGSGEIAINRLRRAILDRTSWRERQFYRARRWWRLVSRVGR
jgi:hypothetical protein